jgi:hypothetical protein
MGSYDIAISIISAAIMEALPKGTDYMEVKHDVVIKIRAMAQEIRDKYDGKE